MKKKTRGEITPNNRPTTIDRFFYIIGIIVLHVSFPERSSCHKANDRGRCINVPVLHLPMGGALCVCTEEQAKQWVRSISFPGSTPVCGVFFFQDERVQIITHVRPGKKNRHTPGSTQGS